MSEGIEARVPELSIAADPLRRLGERRRVQPAVVYPTLFPRFEQPGPLEPPDVLHHGRQRHGTRISELGHRGFATSQPGKDGPPGRVSQGREGVVEGGRMVNHMV